MPFFEQVDKSLDYEANSEKEFNEFRSRLAELIKRFEPADWEKLESAVSTKSETWKLNFVRCAYLCESVQCCQILLSMLESGNERLAPTILEALENTTLNLADIPVSSHVLKILKKMHHTHVEKKENAKALKIDILIQRLKIQ